MFITNIFKDLGIDSRTEFEDSEYNSLLIHYHNINELYKANKEYLEIEAQKNTAEQRLSELQDRNTSVPDNSAQIAELLAFIAEIDAAYPSVGIMDKLALKSAKNEALAEKEQLEQEQTILTTTAAEDEISALATALNAQKIIVNTFANGMDLEDYYE